MYEEAHEGILFPLARVICSGVGARIRFGTERMQGALLGTAAWRQPARLLRKNARLEGRQGVRWTDLGRTDFSTSFEHTSREARTVG